MITDYGVLVYNGGERSLQWDKNEGLPGRVSICLSGAMHYLGHQSKLVFQSMFYKYCHFFCRKPIAQRHIESLMKTISHHKIENNLFFNNIVVQNS